MSGAEMTSAGLNVACAKVDIAPQTSSTIARAEQTEIFCISIA